MTPVVDHTGIRCRFLIIRDLPATLAVEETCPASWSEDDLRRRLARRDTIGQALEVGDRVPGYVVYRLHRRSIEILRLAVHLLWRRSGLATRMVLHLYGRKLFPHSNRKLLQAVVPLGNRGGCAFFRALGFDSQLIAGERVLFTLERK